MMQTQRAPKLGDLSHLLPSLLAPMGFQGRHGARVASQGVVTGFPLGSRPLWPRWKKLLPVTCFSPLRRVYDSGISQKPTIGYRHGCSCLHAAMRKVCPMSPPSQPENGQSLMILGFTTTSMYTSNRGMISKLSNL